MNPQQKQGCDGLQVCKKCSRYRCEDMTYGHCHLDGYDNYCHGSCQPNLPHRTRMTDTQKELLAYAAFLGFCYWLDGKTGVLAGALGLALREALKKTI